MSLLCKECHVPFIYLSESDVGKSVTCDGCDTEYEVRAGNSGLYLKKVYPEKFKE